MSYEIADLSWTTISLLGIVTWLLYVLLIRKNLSPLNKLPGPVTWSLTGNLGEIIRSQPVDPYIKWCDKYGGIIRYNRLFGTFRVVVMEPDAIKHVLVTHSSKYIKSAVLRKNLEPLLGNGLFSSIGKEHAYQKKLINPAFKYTKLKDMVSTFEKYSKQFATLWHEKIEEGTKNDHKNVEIFVHDELNRLTLDIICQCAFGYECNSMLNPDDKVADSLRVMFSGSGITWKDFLPLYSYLPTEAKAKRKRALDTIKENVNKVIDEKMRAAQDVNAEAGTSLLDILISLRDEETNQGLSKKELYDQTVTFMFAGHETTGVSLSWTLYALAQNQDIQSKARDEVRKILKANNDQFTWELLDEFVYLNKVVKESLRLYSPAPLTIRQCEQDDKIGDYFIPKGTKVLVIPPHRWEKYYKDALTFNPDRWDDMTTDDNKNVNSYAYIPFLAGPRSCIGNKFALSEIRCTLAVLLDNFVFNVVPNREVKRRLRITMKPHPSLKLQISAAK